MATRILVVDDEPDLETLVVHKFRKRIAGGELEFRFARDGEDALRVLSLEPDIELIATDINMPVMDGLTLLAQLGKLTRLTKTIIVSAYDDLENIRTAMNRGAYDFVTKPIDFADLERTIDKTLLELGELRKGREARGRLAVLDYELELATKIQLSILPTMIEGHEAFEIDAAMVPARHVSGDFYDFFLIDEKRLGLAIGDVAGKGIPAALFMAVSRTLLRATALQGRPPADCLEHVNRVLLKQSDGEVFLTLLYGIFNLETGAFEFSSGGQPPPFLFSDDGRGEFLREPRGMMLGVMEASVYESRTVTVGPGETLVFYTDGVTEAENGAGEFFAEKGLARALRRGISIPDAGVAAALVGEIRSFAGDAVQTDDITILALRRRG
jgi:sigma-B regulation protein RsbU (phosphoserine phosphatase)